MADGAVPQEQVVFEQGVEGLVRTIGPRMTPQLKARLAGVGLKVDAPLLPAYPLDTWMKCLFVAAEELWPGVPPDQALFQLGEEFIDGYRQTFLGRAMLGLIRVIGPRRTLQRATRNFRTGNNYTESKVTELGPKSLDLWMNEVGPYPTFTQGIVTAAVRASGVAVKLEIKEYDGHACTYRCSWE